MAGSVACTPTYVKEDRTDRRPRELQVVQHVGGTHHVTVVDGPRWLQTFGRKAGQWRIGTVMSPKRRI